MPCSGPLLCSQVPKSPPCAGSFPAVKAALRGLVPIVIDMVNKGRAVPGWTRHEICGPFIRATHSIAVLGWAWGMPGQIRLFLCAVALGFLSELDGRLQRLACVAWGIGRQALQARDPCVIKSRSSQRLHSVHIFVLCDVVFTTCNCLCKLPLVGGQPLVAMPPRLLP